MEEGKNFSAVTVTNGNISTPFPIQQGCHQGDPILGCLFILAIDILALLQKKSTIKPYATKHGIHHLFDIYADDLTIHMSRHKLIIGKIRRMLSKLWRLLKCFLVGQG